MDLPKPRPAVGAVLEATGYHPGRRGRDHLRILAGLAGAGRDRVDHVVIINRGQLRFAGPVRALGRGAVTVRTPRTEQLRAHLVSRGYEATTSDACTLVVYGATAAQVGHVAATERIELHTLIDNGASLEEAFLSLTRPDDTSAPAAITAAGVRA